MSEGSGTNSILGYIRTMPGVHSPSRESSSQVSLTPSGLDMAMPSGTPSTSVPARTYKRYLQDFHEYFIKGKAELR